MVTTTTHSRKCVTAVCTWAKNIVEHIRGDFPDQQENSIDWDCVRLCVCQVSYSAKKNQDLLCSACSVQRTFYPPHSHIWTQHNDLTLIYACGCECRKSSGSINVIGGQAGSIRRVEGRRRHSADENNIQVCFCVLDGHKEWITINSRVLISYICDFRSCQSSPRTQSYLPQSCCPSFLPISHLHLSLLPPSAPHHPSYHHHPVCAVHSCTLTGVSRKGTGLCCVCSDVVACECYDIAGFSSACPWAKFSLLIVPKSSRTHQTVTQCSILTSLLNVNQIILITSGSILIILLIRLN